MFIHNDDGSLTRVDDSLSPKERAEIAAHKTSDELKIEEFLGRLRTAVANNTVYLRAASHTQQEALAQIDALTRQITVVMRVLARELRE